MPLASHHTARIERESIRIQKRLMQLIIFCYKSTTVLAQGLVSHNFGFVHSVLQLSYEEYHRRSHCFIGPTEGEELGRELQPPLPPPPLENISKELCEKVFSVPLHPPTPPQHTHTHTHTHTNTHTLSHYSAPILLTKLRGPCLSTYLYSLIFKGNLFPK